MIFAGSGCAALAGVASLLCARNGNAAGKIGLTGALISVTLCAAGVFSGGAYNLTRTVFLLPTMIIAAAAAFHSVAYIKGHGNPGVYWGFFNLTCSTMMILPMLENFIAFLVIWELMGLFSAVLVMFNYKAEELKRVAWIYLLACEAGGLLLMLFLAGMNRFPNELLFALAAAGFGLKAGFPLLHLWLPEAHPAAPAPVSALMSGAMINLGIYGIIVFASPFGGTAITGWTFLIMGMAGSLGGIIFAFAQDNLKRLLAYSSIENMGIISLAIGLSMLGVHFKNEYVALLGFCGGLFHILNHALLKGTLFLGAGQVFVSTGTLSIDRMGGLMKKMPVTGSLFSLSALGISGLPPFNGFAGELLIYLAAFGGICSGILPLQLAGLAAALVLALTGACAVVAFSKAVGGTFLGEPRQDIKTAPESPWMYIPQLVLMFMALLLVFAAPFLVKLTFTADPEKISSLIMPLWYVSIGSMALCALTAAIFFLRRYLLPRSREEEQGPTWDCGYAKPSARMEYTGSAIVQNLADLFNNFLQIRRKVEPPQGLFPEKASFEWETPDGSERIFWAPLFRFITRISDRIHRFQSGYLHMYVLIMTLALIAMLIYAFREVIK